MQSLKVQATGVLLFLFIPLVLFLYVRHPEPVWASLAGGVVLMVGHRLLARPYMERVLPVKCAWCNRVLPPEGGEILELGEIRARCCPGHRRPAAKFFAFLESWRWVLRAGIFLPLLLLLGALAAAAFGQEAPLEDVTAFFKLIVGLTVNLAAFGYLLAPDRSPSGIPFPVHNFFLLGVRNLLWVFRLIGIWWIWQGLRHFLGG
ncbi:MAG TPA: hypothetical protein VFR31_16655 [Thermoanaerobaculia bacterium]|nr:hypothetical protein [Thermoanaerobaculia bacterium]